MYVSLIMTYRHLEINYGVTYTGSKKSSNTYCTLERSDAVHTYWFNKVFIFAGFSTNMSWITVASLLNFLVALRNSGWSTSCNVYNTTADSILTVTGQSLGTVEVGGNVDFAIMAVALVALLGTYLVLQYGDIPYAFVAMWALGGVYRMQTNNNPDAFPTSGQSSQLAQWAIGMFVVLAIATVASLIKLLWEARSNCCYGKCFQKEIEDENKKVDDTSV